MDDSILLVVATSPQYENDGIRYSAPVCCSTEDHSPLVANVHPSNVDTNGLSLIISCADEFLCALIHEATVFTSNVDAPYIHPHLLDPVPT